MPSAARPRLVAPRLLGAPHQDVWWLGAKAGYDDGYHTLDTTRAIPHTPDGLTAAEKQVWRMGFRTARPFGYKDWAEGLPFTEPPAQPEHIWPEDEDGA